jgi:hypothetical protein
MGTRAHTKFSHRGGLQARRERALERLKNVEEPTDNQLKEIEILQKRTSTSTTGLY